MRRRYYILASLFLAACAMGVLDAAFCWAGAGPTPGRAAWFIRLALPPALVATAAVCTLGLARSVLLIALAVGAGMGAEALASVTVTLFGGRYVYCLGDGQIAFAGVPVLVPVFWAVFIYAGYSLTNSLLYSLGRGKPRRGRSGAVTLLAAVLADAAAVVAIDLFIDPLMVRRGMWSWVESGAYYGVPPRNFLGWAMVAAVATGAFRTWEYFRPRSVPIPAWVHFIPPVCYAVLGLLLVAWSLQERLVGVAAAGGATMGAIALVNLGLFLQRVSARGRSPRQG